MSFTSFFHRKNILPVIYKHLLRCFFVLPVTSTKARNISIFFYKIKLIASNVLENKRNTIFLLNYYFENVEMCVVFELYRNPIQFRFKRMIVTMIDIFINSNEIFYYNSSLYIYRAQFTWECLLHVRSENKYALVDSDLIHDLN